MALKPVTVRFDPEAYDFIAAEAAHLGVSTGEYVRTAALARAAIAYARRAPDTAAHLAGVFAAAAELLEQADPLRMPEE